MTNYVIETNGLYKKYGNNAVVNNLNMNVEKGEIYGLLGRNGAGKTTTMCMLLGLTSPTEGSIKLFGKNINDNSKDIYNNIGSIIEVPGFYPHLNAKDNLKIFSKIRGDYNEERIDEIIKLVELDDHKNKKFKQYSLGMKQRLGIAAAIVHNPDLLILDEPINGLDPIGIKQIRDILISLKEDHGVTIVISSHILKEIEAIADKIGIMNKGVMVQEISKEEIHNLASKYVEFVVNDLELSKELLIKEGFKEFEDFEVSNTIKLFKNFDARVYLNALFVKNGIEVSEITVNDESLEDYFVDLLNGE